MVCRDTTFSGLTQSLAKGFLTDAVVLDVAQRQSGRPASLNPEELYQRAIDLCIEERRQELLPELKRLRDRHGVTYDQLNSVRQFFRDLGRDYLYQTEECLAGN